MIALSPSDRFQVLRALHCIFAWIDLDFLALPFTLLFWVQVYAPFLCFLCREDPLAFVEELVWWCWILFRFCLPVKLLISPSSLNEILAGYSNLAFSLSSLSVCPAIPFWPEEFLLKDQLLSLWGSPCGLLVAFPLLLLIVLLFVFDLP